MVLKQILQHDSIPLLELLRLAQDLQLSSVVLVLVVVPSIVSAEVSTPSSSEESASSIHGSQRPRGVHQLEGVLVLLVVVGVLGATLAELRRVLVHVASVSVGVAGPVRNLDKNV